MVPGLFAIARWSVFVPLIVMEQTPRTGLGALSRSNRLVRGYSGVAFWIVLLPLLAAEAIQTPSFVFHNVELLWFDVAVRIVWVAYAGVAGAVLYGRLLLLPRMTESPILVEPSRAVVGTGSANPPLSAAEAARRRLWKP